MSTRDDLLHALVVVLLEIVYRKEAAMEQLALWREEYVDSITPVCPYSVWPSC